jgi:hypothetical protein
MAVGGTTSSSPSRASSPATPTAVAGSGERTSTSSSPPRPRTTAYRDCTLPVLRQWISTAITGTKFYSLPRITCFTSSRVERELNCGLRICRRRRRKRNVGSISRLQRSAVRGMEISCCKLPIRPRRGEEAGFLQLIVSPIYETTASTRPSSGVATISPRLRTAGRGSPTSTATVDTR